MERSIGIIGAGAWGTAMGMALAGKGHKVQLWAYEKELVAEINEKHTNTPYLPDVTLPESITATTDLIEAASGKEHLILAIPSLFLPDSAKKLIAVPSVRDGKTIISILTKGLLETPKGFRLITDVLEDYLPGLYRGNLVYVSGPSHAEEVARGKITGLVAASANPKNAIMVRDMMNGPKLMVFASLDPIGVQVCAAAKNVIAIAFGMLDALKASSQDFGDNTESLLLAAGLNEIQLLGRAMGATHPETFTSIAGVGDLDVTCRSIFGRNRRFGRDLIEKKTHEKFTDLDDLLARIREVGYLPEGAAACKGIRAVSQEKKLKLPICDGVYRILNREATPEDILQSLYGTTGKAARVAEKEWPIVDPVDGAELWPVGMKYAAQISTMQARSKAPARVTEESVYQEANAGVLAALDEIVADCLAPGSEIRHFENVGELLKKSQEGASCAILMEHYSNLDLPAFSWLLRRSGEAGLEASDALLAIADIRLSDESEAVRVAAEAFSRVIVYPGTVLETIKEKNPKAAITEVMRSSGINRAATRVVEELRGKKRLVLIFPTGTRFRPWDPSTKKGMREVDGYLRNFDYMVMVSVNGQALRLNPDGSEGEDLATQSRVVFDVSPVIACAAFRDGAKTTHFGEDKRQIVADTVMKALEEMHAANVFGPEPGSKKA